MKKNILILLVILAIASTTNQLKSQTYGFGTISGDAGAGFGIYGIRAYSPINLEEHTGIGFVGTLPCVDVDFGLLRFIGVGVHYRRGTYGSYNNGKIRGNDFCAMANFHLLNKKDKFDLIVGAGYGISSMKTNSGLLESISAKGGIMRIHVTPHFYFGKYIGMFIRLAYNKHFLNNKLTLIDSNGKAWTQAQGATWNMGGVEFNMGVAFKLALFNKNEESK